MILGYAAVSQCASAAAPLLAGSIVNDDSWRILYIVLGLGAAAAAVLVTVPASEGSLDKQLRGQSAQTSTDFIGIGLLALLISAYAYTMGYGEQRDWLNADDVAFATRLLAIVAIAFLAWAAIRGARSASYRWQSSANATCGLASFLGLAARVSRCMAPRYSCNTWKAR